MWTSPGRSRFVSRGPGLCGVRALFFAVLLVPASTAWADAFLESVFPPVVQRGTTNRMEVRGREISQVLGLWTSSPGAAIVGRPITAGDGTSVTLEVTVPADAPMGIYGLRLATRSGLSNPCLFVVDELPVTRVDSAAISGKQTAGGDGLVGSLKLPACMAAPCREATIDRYALDVQAGQRLTFEVIGNRLGRNFDPLVTIRDAGNQIVAQGDNDLGLFFDCRFEQTFEKSGRYTVEVSDARFAGDAHWNYVLRVGDFPVARTAVPMQLEAGRETLLRFPQSPDVTLSATPPSGWREGAFWQEVRSASGKPATWVALDAGAMPNLMEFEPNNTVADATPVYGPACWNGVLESPGDEDWYLFELTKGESLRVRSDSQRFGSAADLELALFEPSNEPNGREVLRVDETTVRDDPANTTLATEASFLFTARTDGPHWLQVRDLSGGGGPAYTYRLEAGPNSPELKLFAEVSALAVPRRSFQPVPLKVTRSGFQGPIELTLLGAPPGVSLEPKIIPENATEFVCRIQAEDGAAEAIHTVQIVGRFKSDSVDVSAVATMRPLIDRQPRNKDRILYALRADQRELPPSLTNRMAVQIMPPAPFDLQLPDEVVLLPKYLAADVRIVTKREPALTSPIRFSVQGGQIGEEAEERVQVYARIPDATAQAPEVAGTLFNRILTRYEKHRVDLTATAEFEGHSVSLTRTFMLDIRSAFSPEFQPAEVEAMPGETVVARVVANRVPAFNGAIELTPQNPPAFLIVPESFPIAAGQAEAEMRLQIRPDATPGRHQVRFESTGYVGRFQELLRSPVLTVNVKKPPEPAKK